MFKKNHIKLVEYIIFSVIIMCTVNCNRGLNQSEKVACPGKKKIPRITLKNISPPFLDYNYLQESINYGFRFNEISFNLINAWWMAEVATLVYANEDFVKPVFKRVGLPEVKFFNKRSTQCYVASNERFAIIAFRGSEIWKKREKANIKEMLSDLKTIIDVWLVDWQQGGKVHRGFKKALDEVWQDLSTYTRTLQEKGCKIWVTGHSLGGALATLFASRYGNVQGVYTFGSPRVGNEVFKQNTHIKIYRFVNHHDIVPRLPLLGGYVHVGELRYIDDEGIIRKTTVKNKGPVDDSQDPLRALENNCLSVNNASKGFVPPPFRDHVPLLYTVFIWNNMIESQKQSINSKIPIR